MYPARLVPAPALVRTHLARLGKHFALVRTLLDTIRGVPGIVRTHLARLETHHGKLGSLPKQPFLPK